MSALDVALRVEAVSRAYEAEPVGAPGTPVFLNAAVAVRSALDPGRMKYGVLRPIEAELGRERSTDPNAPRTIDIDIAIIGDEVIEDAELGLRIPDPDIVRFAHLAFPLRDVAPDHTHPVAGRTLAAVADELDGTDGIHARPDIDLGSLIAGDSADMGA